ncbi:hypothetical protein [Dokdonella sp.]|uniref:hypothetical protein n=1 Tax=Dokdonella sp. TaxID=2291710 RepID=UPI001B2F55CF|nr:hypothetical protein [Dokdonella sp.]MBO9663700.1 hypothetical protein [Dokdonella sp.]
MPGSQLLALSRDGRAGAGSLIGASTGGFRWSEAKGIQPLPGAMSVRGVSASGRYVAGSSIDAEQREVASYWTAEGELVRIGALPDTAWQGGLISIAFGISDEPRVVGVASNPEQRSTAFEWTADGGMRALPLPAEAKAARAGGVSDDGRHIYGWVESASGSRRGVLWRDGAPRLLGAVGGVAAGEVLGGNRDLSVLLGIDVPHGRGGDVAYRWSTDGGAQALKPGEALPSPLRLFVSSDDGRTLVGSAGNGANRVAVAWTAAAGLRSLDALLAAHGVAVPAGWTLAAATGISGDGRRIGGWGQHDGHVDSFVVELPDARDAASAGIEAPPSG